MSEMENLGGRLRCFVLAAALVIAVFSGAARAENDEDAAAAFLKSPEGKAWAAGYFPDYILDDAFFINQYAENPAAFDNAFTGRKEPIAVVGRAESIAEQRKGRYAVSLAPRRQTPDFGLPQKEDATRAHAALRLVCELPMKMAASIKSGQLLLVKGWVQKPVNGTLAIQSCSLISRFDEDTEVVGDSFTRCMASFSIEISKKTHQPAYEPVAGLFHVATEDLAGRRPIRCDSALMSLMLRCSQQAEESFKPIAISCDQRSEVVNFRAAAIHQQSGERWTELTVEKPTHSELYEHLVQEGKIQDREP